MYYSCPTVVSEDEVTTFVGLTLKTQSLPVQWKVRVVWKEKVHSAHEE